MKFKLQANTGDLLQKIDQEVANKMPVNAMLDIEAECTLEELKGLYELQKDAIKEAPELLRAFFENIATVVPAFNKFDEAVCGMINTTRSATEATTDDSTTTTGVTE